MPSPVTELIGVYAADGGAIGELRYVVGKLLGGAHCSLCDVTHSPLRRKPDWDAMVARRGVPFLLLHRNELPADVAQVVGRTGTPVVLARTADGGLAAVLDPQALDRLDGSVPAFERALDAALATPAADG